MCFRNIKAALELLPIKCHALRVHLHCRQRCDCSACRDTPSTSAKGPVLWLLCQPTACLSFLDECQPASPADMSHLHVALAVAWWQMQTDKEKAKWKDQTWAVLLGVWWLLPQPLWYLGKGTEYLSQAPPSLCGALCSEEKHFLWTSLCVAYCHFESISENTCLSSPVVQE